MTDAKAAIRAYVERCLNLNGMKCLLLDNITKQIVSCVMSQTEILNQQVYLIRTLEDPASQQHPQHLKAVVLVRPTPHNIELLQKELARPAFAEYHIYFTGILTKGLLRNLAEADFLEKVQQVQEFFCDYLPIDETCLSLNAYNSLAMTVAAGTSWAPKFASLYERHLQGLQSMLLARKKQPSCIRYAASSPCAEEIAKDLHDIIQQDDLFHFRHGPKSGLLVLILDRRDDPVTPLLSQWTYQAMVHELLGVNNHRVVLKGAPNVSKDLEEVVLQDAFFDKNKHKNFGELGEEIQRLLQDYQKTTKQHSVDNLNSIEDMQAFLDKFPELRSQSHVVSKHVAIMGELARLVEVCHLMDVSQLEQELACSDDHNNHWRELLEKLNSKSIKTVDKLRMGLLYALKYEQVGNLHMLQSALAKGGVPQGMIDSLKQLLRYGGTKARAPGLFGQNDRLSKMTKSIMTSVQGVQNVYAQHVPLLMDTIGLLQKGRLTAKSHPVVLGSCKVALEQFLPTEVLVFMVGGTTYEEVNKVAEFNASQRQLFVTLAGSTIHNSTSFLDELKGTSL